MPLYEYQCESCDERFERIQRFSDPPVAECPACGGPVRKLLSSPAIQFKGSGWYITDYAKKGSGKDGKDGKDAKDKPAAGKDGAASSSSGGDSGSGTAGAAKESSAPAAKDS
jgi:putative FmdB family regulatory protein